MKINNLSAYTRFPEKLKEQKPELCEMENKDVFGVADRFKVIKKEFPGGKVALDLGGNSGFFSLSMIEQGLLDKSTVYDTNEKALESGREMASLMGISSKIDFVNHKIDLDFIQNMNVQVDTVISLNLLHHAGSLFDQEIVKKIGWENYTSKWLDKFSQICDICIIGIGFKNLKPPYWDVKKYKRPYLFKKIAATHGWKAIYDANVQDIYNFGVEKADGKRTKSPSTKDYLRYKLQKTRIFMVQKMSLLLNFEYSKRYKYHIYIFRK